MPRLTSRCTTSVSPSTLAFTFGYSCTTSENARTMNGRYVSEKPSSAFHSAWCARRTRSIALEVDARPTCRRARSSRATAPCARRCGGGCCRTARSRRRSPRATGGAAGAGAGAGAAGRGRRRSRGRGTAGARRLQHVVAGDAAAFAGAAGSGPRRGPACAISWRTIGDVTVPPPLPAARPRRARAPARARAGGAGAGGGRRRRRRRRGRRWCGRRVPPAASRPRAPAARRGGPATPPGSSPRSPRGARRPGPSRLRARRSRDSTPAWGAGTSESTLSVDTSNSGSSASILLADLLEPASDRALGDGLTELRHRHIHMAPPTRVRAARRPRRHLTV